jgi:membrane protein YdbS with pleckstrin-like domain
MSKIDRVKEVIGWLKVAFGALIAIDVSMIAWLAQNVSTADTGLKVLAIIGIAVVTIGIVWVNHAAFRRIAQLEDL